MLGFRKETIERFIWYVLGLNLIAVAVVLNIRYVMGVAAFSSVMYAISQIYHISLGTASILCYLLFVLIQCVLSRKIKAVYLLEIPLSLAFGVVTDVYDWLIPEFHFPAYISMTLFLLTMFVTALGVFLCVKTNFVLTPTEGIVQTISEVFHIAFSSHDYHLVCAFVGLDCSLVEIFLKQVGLEGCYSAFKVFRRHVF